MTPLDKYTVEYSSNNSGGNWWLSDNNWQELEKNGWTVEWGGKDFCNNKYRLSLEEHTAPETCDSECRGHIRYKSLEDVIANDGKWLGTVARTATIEVEAYSESLAEGLGELWWTKATGLNPKEKGCNCCGRPHDFWATKSDD